jgi:hypothetical protein
VKQWETLTDELIAVVNDQKIEAITRALLAAHARDNAASTLRGAGGGGSSDGRSGIDTPTPKVAIEATPPTPTTLDTERPPQSFAELAYNAIVASASGEATVQEIYHRIGDQYPFYKNNGVCKP